MEDLVGYAPDGVRRTGAGRTVPPVLRIFADARTARRRGRQAVGRVAALRV